METINDISAVSAQNRPWNKGKLIGPKPPLQPKHVWAIRTRLQLTGRTRDLALRAECSPRACAQISPLRASPVPTA